jgi:broad specificity phosphatase PhoE
MKHLYFIRHGQSELNVLGIFAGSIDTPLTDIGRLQAKQAASEIKSLGIDLIVTSDLSRASETARIIAEEINYATSDIISEALFTEQSYGSLEGKPWTTSVDPNQYPDIETDAEVMARARSGLEYLRKLNADTILLVSHGSYSRALRAAIHGEDMKTDEPGNAKVVQFI